MVLHVQAMMTLKALQEGVQIGSRVVPLVQAMMTLKALQEGNKDNNDAVASGLSHETHKGISKYAVRSHPGWDRWKTTLSRSASQ